MSTPRRPKWLQLRRVAARGWRSLNQTLLHAAELATAPPADTVPAHPVIFFLGAPRTGSTLAMQVLTDAFDVGYLSNAHCRYFGAPSWVERHVRPLANKRPSDFVSQHGNTRHAYDPAECGEWWYRFFRREPAYVTCGDVSVRKLRQFRQAVLALGQACDRPLVFKNLFAGLRLEPLVAALPEALFIVVERDLVATAQSILKTRKDKFGDYRTWWSLRPPSLSDEASSDPVEQVVAQVRGINALIADDLERLGVRERAYTLCYEDFCADVPATLETLRAFLAQHGALPAARFDVPARFPVRQRQTIPEPMLARLRALADHA